MKRGVVIALAAGVVFITTLCLGLFLVFAFSPVRAQAARVIERVAQRLNLDRDARVFENRGSQNSAAEQGILVVGVLSGSPAEQAGLRRGDILMEVNNQAVNNLPDLLQALSRVNDGDEVRLDIQRGDDPLALTVTADSSAQQVGPMHGGMLGIVPYTGDMLRGQDRLPEFNQAARSGARITNVVEDSPAEQAGLQVGDWIVAIDGSEITQPADVSSIVQQSQPGDTLTLTVEDSAGQQREVTVTLSEKPDSQPANQAWLGISLSSGVERSLPNLPLDPRLPGGQGRGQNGPDGSMMVNPSLPDGYDAGALLMDVTENGPAAKAGLKPGQVILAIDGQVLTSAEQLRTSIAAHQPGDEVTLTVSGPDEQAAQEVTVTLAENPDQAGAAYLGIRFGFFEVTPPATPAAPVN
jgi:S1-C subfamily serine protease